MLKLFSKWTTKIARLALYPHLWRQYPRISLWPGMLRTAKRTPKDPS